MKILSIETSCDETAISILEASGDEKSPVFSLLANGLISQIEAHQEFGGVYPTLAKREHAKNLPIILEQTLKDAKMFEEENSEVKIDEDSVGQILEREEGLAENLLKILNKIRKPDIDYIAVTTGPGLEPALWVGITFAKALSKIWEIPLVPINHMEGHILSVLLDQNKKSIDIKNIKFPVLSVLVSGGHTQLVLVEDWMKYKIVGETVDDAVGEAFDKVARILGLPYPGGPEISRLAKEGKENKKIKLPRPMLRTEDYDFSFSGLKTAVLYLVRDIGELSEQDKKDIAKEFQTAVGDVFVHKIKKAIEKYGVSQIIVAGGVAANEYLRERFKNELNIEIFLPEKDLSTDNAIMIGMAGYFGAISEKETSPDDNVRALSSLSL